MCHDFLNNLKRQHTVLQPDFDCLLFPCENFWRLKSHPHNIWPHRPLLIELSRPARGLWQTYNPRAARCMVGIHRRPLFWWDLYTHWPHGPLSTLPKRLCLTEVYSSLHISKHTYQNAPICWHVEWEQRGCVTRVGPQTERACFILACQDHCVQGGGSQSWEKTWPAAFTFVIGQIGPSIFDSRLCNSRFRESKAYPRNYGHPGREPANLSATHKSHCIYMFLCYCHLTDHIIWGNKILLRNKMPTQILLMIPPQDKRQYVWSWVAHSHVSSL